MPSTERQCVLRYAITRQQCKEESVRLHVNVLTQEWMLDDLLTACNTPLGANPVGSLDVSLLDMRGSTRNFMHTTYDAVFSVSKLTDAIRNVHMIEMEM